MNLLICEGNKDSAAKMLLKSWSKVIRTELLSEYLAWLTEDIEGSDYSKTGSCYLPEQFSDGTLYLNIDDGRIIYRYPNRIVLWMLTREEIKKNYTKLRTKLCCVLLLILLL
ncbi:unnamed protein product [Gongylonema pulchrum]|uniref:Uncharacterized protein n=1 Tax=Gongylonema pulchrum TaxID=637853 RepID=A0A3P7MHS2_9BILA|nr:unnamed protein product [Gongylonema pulchrum]